uniref:Protein kinase domain-containing protein n=1 Tax=Globisporangium ultimum (strain ATCC 200006 / CBS 805.95 / DAOM BR144) TaxID=431595 RepID=K3WF86_GLOUD
MGNQPSMRAARDADAHVQYVFDDTVTGQSDSTSDVAHNGASADSVGCLEPEILDAQVMHVNDSSSGAMKSASKLTIDTHMDGDGTRSATGAGQSTKELLVEQDASAPVVLLNRRVEDVYDVQTQNIGRGHYAVVCRGKCKRTGRAVAVKKIKRFLSDEKRLKAEISVLRRVKHHPNIVELIDVFETAREVHLVLELCTGGELFERLADKGPYSEADCVRHVRDMARAVQYLHALCGYHPFDPDGESSDNDMVANIKACRFDFDDEVWDTISTHVKDLICHLLVLDPADRYTMQQVLEHPWITSVSEIPASSLPLSPTIHRDLAKFRENSKFKDCESFGYDAYTDQNEAAN